MKRQKPIQIEVKPEGKHFAVRVEEQLVALAVYRKGAETLKALLCGLRRYTSRKFFRLALKDAFNPPKVEAKPTTKAAQKGGSTSKPQTASKAKSASKSKTTPKTETAPPKTEAPAVEQQSTTTETAEAAKTDTV